MGIGHSNPRITTTCSITKDPYFQIFELLSKNESNIEKISANCEKQLKKVEQLNDRVKKIEKQKISSAKKQMKISILAEEQMIDFSQSSVDQQNCVPTIFQQKRNERKSQKVANL